MIEGFENAFEFFRERQEHVDEIQAKVNGINGPKCAEIEAIDKAIETIDQRIKERDSAHYQNLPPEAFKGYGGQTPQYYDNYEYCGTEEELAELDQLEEKRKAIIKEISNAEIFLL